MGLSQLYCRLMHMFSLLGDDDHECNMDNLYNSASFTRAAWLPAIPQEVGQPRRKRVKTQCVIRAPCCGALACIKQVLPKRKAVFNVARGMTKVAVLCGNLMPWKLIVGSCINQKLYYILPMATEFIEWVVKSKTIYSYTKQK